MTHREARLRVRQLDPDGVFLDHAASAYGSTHSERLERLAKWGGVPAEEIHPTRKALPFDRVDLLLGLIMDRVYDPHASRVFAQGKD